LKLRRGHYAIAVGTRPEWKAVAFIDTPEARSSIAGPLVFGSGRQRVDFDYLFVSIA
jgi:hypothetical protein